ncbi:universal stress protein [Christiangramia salexigens]|uniref:Universal stress protein n=1 Tax=Christiangramia salexigens TaxID=1913577 RepID=A0A1L3J1L3_9FLAO|nr:universal stress protein [Christiangramia salexigens]APG59032.1 universal stress protein [Christiangramia salexigens]
MEKKILIPTNFSKHAWNALIFAMKLYKKHACTFYLINVYQSQGFLNEAIPLAKNDDDEESGKELSEKGLARIMQGLSFRRENSKHQFETISFKGSLVDGMQEAIDKYGIDLIIAGSDGDTAGINTAAENKISKITENVEQCPVLVIPENYELREDKPLEIVFPSNFRLPFKQKDMQALIELANGLKASVRVLYINTDDKKLTNEQEENKKELETHFSDTRFSFHTLTKTSASTGVHLFIESRDSDLLAIYQRKQGFFSRLFSKAALDEIDFDPKLPVLILKEFK